MPLVVPGINNTMPGGDQGDWLNKLAGKKITTEAVGGVDSFAKQDLPQSHRICKPGDAMTMDYRSDRLNIHVDENGTVRDVNYG
ncbi:hypothetical protein P168DRAFT_316002 [Aspergillus campestris IBT 28561]|uniref:Proteinase inhibitor I78 n=1 Tax=Aspergillus campestris (strain IBT 28561) TaxID=1392248 RepID=A0A2I1DCA2_ASPC2|nr:uncharacterized protein P168DRAFT_316002 [Aspergillus campestris IBT 28561]PKY07498.1 hypothetical protein P168DRAFT_316002 [Aspergillus campestris IBT 28561]